MKPKKDELIVLRTIYDQEWEDDDAYLSEMFSTVVELLAKRDSWGVGVRYTDSSGVTPFGPWYNKAQAAKAGREVGGALSTAEHKVEIFLQQLKAPASIITIEENTEHGE